MRWKVSIDRIENIKWKYNINREGNPNKCQVYFMTLRPYSLSVMFIHFQLFFNLNHNQILNIYNNNNNKSMVSLPVFQYQYCKDKWRNLNSGCSIFTDVH